MTRVPGSVERTAEGGKNELPMAFRPTWQELLQGSPMPTPELRPKPTHQHHLTRFRRLPTATVSTLLISRVETSDQDAGAVGVRSRWDILLKQRSKPIQVSTRGTEIDEKRKAAAAQATPTGLPDRAQDCSNSSRTVPQMPGRAGLPMPMLRLIWEPTIVGCWSPFLSSPGDSK